MSVTQSDLKTAYAKCLQEMSRKNPLSERITEVCSSAGFLLHHGKPAEVQIRITLEENDFILEVPEHLKKS